MDIKIKTVAINTPDDVNVILGQAHFIKTVDDLYEALVGSVPGIKFGLAFCEASGAALVRIEGNDEGLKTLAAQNVLAVAAGHVFLIAIKDAYPVNVLNAVKAVPEVCRIFCATANALQVIVAHTDQGRGVMGIVDGCVPCGIEGTDDVRRRKEFLRKVGYKR